jgi:hypothetical protein
MKRTHTNVILPTRSEKQLRTKTGPEKYGKRRMSLNRLETPCGFFQDCGGLKAIASKHESFAMQAVDVLDKHAPSKAKAMAYSNMSQLKMYQTN